MSHNSRLGNITHLVSAPCSTGKTHAVCQFMDQTEDNIIYIASSLALLKQTRLSLRSERGQRVTMITSATVNSGSVKEAIIKHAGSCSDGRERLLITWQSYVDLDFIPNRENWTVIIDEVPQLDAWQSFRLPEHHQLLLDHIEIENTHGSAKIGALKARNPSRLKALLEGRRDDVNEMFRPLFRDVLGANKLVYVDLEAWQRLAEKRQFGDDDESNRFCFLTLLQPKLFRNAIIIGANIEESLLYRQLAQAKFNFEEFEPIVSKLRKRLELGDRVRVSYFIPGRHASKALYRKTSVGGGALIDEMDDLAKAAFGSEKFLYVANNDRKSSLDDHEPAKKIPVISHGLNCYSDYDNIYFSAALNREPKHFQMLEAFGFEPDFVHRASGHEVIYQAVMRTSLRKTDAKEVVHAIVPDEMSAKQLAALLGTDNVTQLGDLIPRSRPPLTATDKRRRSVAGKAAKAMFAPKMIPESSLNEVGIESGVKSTAASNSNTCFVTFHGSPYDECEDEHVTKEVPTQELIKFLRQTARASIDQKADAALFNACRFAPPEGAPGFRKKEYFKHSSFMILDFDNGNLSKDDFIRIFWKKAKSDEKRSFVICNSFSRSPEKPNKFRVVMFYKSRVTTLVQHRAIFDEIVRRLVKNGYTGESAELDRACRSGVHSFYLPSKNPKFPSWAFFETYGSKTRDLDKYAIDPSMYPTSEPKQIGIPSLSANSITTSTASREQIDAATAQLRSLREGRNATLFKAAMNLARLGLIESEVEAELVAAVGSERRMKKKIDDAIRSLGQPQYKWVWSFNNAVYEVRDVERRIESA